MTSLTRRSFVQASLSSAGGLILSFSVPVLASRRPWQQSDSAASEINAWLTIDPDDSIVIRVAQSEMGQGVMTALPMIIAEELEADWRKVTVEYADVNRQIREGQPYGRMWTGGSMAVSHSREFLQLAGAEARERLIKAAAETWVVSASECYADYGRVHHRGSNRSFSYGEVAPLAARVNVANVDIKIPDEFNFLGLPTRRLDVPAKVDGSAVYSMDVRLPDMVYAAVKHSPVPGGQVRSIRINAIRNQPGFIKAMRMESAVAIVAETFWQAKKGADELPVYWDFGEAEKSFSDTIKQEFFDQLGERGEVMSEKGEIVALMDNAEKSIESDYFAPYLAHAAMEPLNATVHVQAERVDIWVGHQNPEYAVQIVSEVTGIRPENVYLHNCHIGGGFGRRSHGDFVEEATRIAMEVGRPVQMIWTREEEMRAGAYRPMSAMRFKAGFDISKKLVAITNHSVTHSIRYDQDPEMEGIDSSSVQGLHNHPYMFPAWEFSHSRKNTHLTSWWWRSVGSSINAWAMECFVDEMAVAADKDPMAYRRRLLQMQPDYLDVLDVLEQESGWGKTELPKDTAMGMAIHESCGTIVAIVAEVTVESTGSVRVNKVTAAVDCGNLVNPMTAEEQVEGAILFGLTAALYGKLTVENGQILEDNLDTYEIIRMHEAPEIKIHWALSGAGRWGGLGEPATPVIAPAVCNAIYKITGRRIRSLPIKDYYLQVRR
ncbi:MAG: xanthine dehydrogenase family protein molybdopterin-binding subunit [Gammaproteobacteria bacterium]|nr:xanthine dehydrogenase family protein molybdopterin-binding subunit [Gammaproteobacteria bacterium]